ncbi:MAG TPA: rRNA maturation RNase YbeY [Flavobacteriales bacterium]|nr:rRNA maturation RNase YbeY [Flavobacteriales bacterium]|tara:strand:- start:102664 stop:103080 length:417 start_codon:yes stop_codon:yes gene_type:complete
MSEINYFFEDIDSFEIPDNISHWIKNTITSEGKTLGNLNYIFCSDNYILEINKQYLNHNYFTDIITFNYCKDNVVSGDIFISVDTVKSNAKEYKQDYNNELNRVIIHGVLHLLGYNDKSETELFEMRQKEDFYLNLLP